MAWDDMAKFPAYHPQSHVPVEASGNMTDMSMHPLWPTLNFLLMQKVINIRFIGRCILFCVFMAKDSWHGVIRQNFLPIRLL